MVEQVLKFKFLLSSYVRHIPKCINRHICTKNCRPQKKFSPLGIIILYRWSFCCKFSLGTLGLWPKAESITSIPQLLRNACDWFRVTLFRCMGRHPQARINSVIRVRSLTFRTFSCDSVTKWKYEITRFACVGKNVKMWNET